MKAVRKLPVVCSGKDLTEEVIDDDTSENENIGLSHCKLQNGIILLIFKIWKIWDIRFVQNLILNNSCEFQCGVIYKYYIWQRCRWKQRSVIHSLSAKELRANAIIAIHT